MKLPKKIRERAKQIDRSRFEIVRRTNHFAIVERGTGRLIMPLHSNEGSRAAANLSAEMKRLGVLKGGS